VFVCVRVCVCVCVCVCLLLGGEVEHPRQAFYYLSHTPSPFIYILFLRQDLTNFAQAGLKFTILLPLLSEKLGLQAYATMCGYILSTSIGLIY
jgi:hypothetical protein